MLLGAALHQPELLIERIYASALRPALWPGTLKHVADFTGSRDCLFQCYRVAPTHTQAVFSYAGEIDRPMFDQHTTVVEAFGDIRAEFIATVPSGRIYHDRDFISEREMRTHPYYQELLSPQDFKYCAMTTGTIEQTPGGAARVRFRPAANAASGSTAP